MSWLSFRYMKKLQDVGRNGKYICKRWNAHILLIARKYCDMTPESRNSPLLGNGWVNRFRRI
jgi:hypothetical protein